MSEVEIAYAKSPLSVGRHAGDRLPPPQHDGPAPGRWAMPRFVLFSADPARDAALAARFPGVLDPRPRTPPNAHSLLIIRPDGYVGLSAEDDSWAEAERYVQLLAA